MPLACCCFFLGLASAHAAPPPSPVQGADQALRAFEGGDEETLKNLAARNKPDPWLVADQLVARGRHDAAEAFAKAAPRALTAKLPYYVWSRREQPSEDTERRVLADMMGALDRNEPLDAVVPVPERLDSVTTIQIATYRALALQRVHQPKESAKGFLAAGRAAEKLGWLWRAGMGFNRAASVAFRSADWKAADETFRAALAIARRLGHGRAVASTLHNLGVVHKNLGNYDEALVRFEESLGIKRGANDRAGAARTLNSIATVHQEVGRYPLALERYDEALKIQRALKDVSGESTTRANLGTLHTRLGTYPEALAHFQAALAITRRLNKTHVLVDTLGNIGSLHMHLGEYAAAIEHLEESRRIAEEVKDTSSAAHAMMNLGIVYRRIGEPDAALEHLEQARAAAEAIGEKALAAYSLHNSGGVHIAVGNYAAAAEPLEAALARRRALGDAAGVATTLSDLGLVHAHQGKVSRALELLNDALTRRRALGTAGDVAETLCNIGATHRGTGDFKSACTAYDEAYALLEGSPARERLAHACWGLAEVALATAGDAATWARRGIEHVNALSSGLSEGAGARELFAGLFDAGYRAALRADNTEDLFWFLEQGRAGSLREGLGSRSALEAAVIPAALRRALSLARSAERHALDAYGRAMRSRSLRSIRAARKTWEAARDEVAKAEARIQRTARSAADVTVAPPITLAALRSQFEPDEVLLLFGLTSDEGLALVVRADGARVVRLPPSDAIATAVDALLADDRRHIVPKEAAPLAKLIIEPLRLGDDVRRVLVSPTGRLGYVPFTLLLPKREVVYVPSATTYRVLREQGGERGAGILALGDPDYGTHAARRGQRHRAGALHSLVPLPASRNEVSTIGTAALVGSAASETNVARRVAERERWRAVHFACHGLVDAERPMFSSLALARDADNDGFLTALEIFRLRVPADLVTMSACETAKGRIYRTEGIVGLTRAFMHAGAPRVLCSLWKVDDEATQALMIRFYELWDPKDGTEGLDAPAALRKAQAFVRGFKRDEVDAEASRKAGRTVTKQVRTWQHPYFWAAWVLWGLP